MKTNYKHYQITSVYKGTKNWNFNKDINNYNNHIIYITNKETKQRCSFEYWGSVSIGEITTEQGLLDALFCFINDSSNAIDDIDYFINCFGYDYNEGKRIYNLCKKSLDKFNRVFTEDICDILNDLIDNYNC